MRPIDKGSSPLDSNQKPIQFKTYQHSRGHLISRLGLYCSYCERFLGGDLAVEHIQAKSKHSDLELDWDNFLIACKNCNSVKGDQEVVLTDYFWPDKDNTFLAFTYISGGMIITSSALTKSSLELAKNTINLTGLDRTPSYDVNANPEMSDRRWAERRTAWEKAERAKKNLMKNDTDEMRSQILDTATSTGFFSVWMTIFQHDRDMLERFINTFPGTSSSCFNSNFVAIKRTGGVI